MSNQSFSKIWIVIILTILVGGGILAWQSRLMPKAEIKMLKVKVPEKVAEDETVDWKIYRNEEHGFEIKYPKDFFTKNLKAKNFIILQFMFIFLEKQSYLFKIG